MAKKPIEISTNTIIEGTKEPDQRHRSGTRKLTIPYTTGGKLVFSALYNCVHLFI